MNKKKTIPMIVLTIAVCSLVGNMYLQSMTVPEELEEIESETVEIDGFEEAAKLFAQRIVINKEEAEEYTRWSSDFASEDLDIDLDGYDVTITYTEGSGDTEAIAVATNRLTGEVVETNYEFAAKEDCSTAILFSAEGDSYDATEIVTAVETCLFWFAAIPLAKLLAAAIAAVVVVASIPLICEAFKTIGTALYDQAVNYYKKHDIFLPKKDVKTVVWQPVVDGVCVAVQDSCVLAVMIGKNTFSITKTVDISVAKNYLPGHWYPAILTKKSTKGEEIPPVIIHTHLSEKVVKALMGNKGSNAGSDHSYYINVFTPTKATATKLMSEAFQGYIDHASAVYHHIHHPGHTWKDPDKPRLGYYYPCHLFFGR